ncbi:putative CmcJ-like methyltransferase [Polychaeton citri CBS 116435]|uniref:CmcJ-like methyltransferase n=1 Tax=Polychaeton citri CBS 116435 TaxID=1314669 RepID=A0A9P4US27_9PEZI|nr:putative CmcJ-like methyltransferase [Polychaeton citri CBS 116435]
MLQTQIRYLVRDELYQREKPYAADFEVDEQDGAQKSNFIIENHDVQIMPVTHHDGFQLDVHGFCVLKENTSLTLEDAIDRSEQVELQYQAQLEQVLRKHFPKYTRLEALDFVVRKRHPRFPSDTLEIIDFEQPAAVAHTDYTCGGAVQQLHGSFPGQHAHFLGKDYDLIKYVTLWTNMNLDVDQICSVWKPLVGPNDDWPLALCDFSSVQTSDMVQADVLHVDRTTENQLLYRNDQHRWYYVKDQQPNHLVVFRNVDSTGKRAVAFHAAVPNPSSIGPPRTSIEVRFVAFR